MDVTSFLEWSVYGNALLGWGVAGTVTLVVLAGLMLLKRIALRQLRVLATRVDSPVGPVSVETVRRTTFWFLLLLAVRAGSLALELAPRAAALLQTFIVIGLLLQLAIWANAAAQTWLKTYTERNLDTDAAGVTSMRAVVFIGRVIAWAVVLLMALDNLGVNITALVAGLGVGGIAVALAVQNILGDLFASLSIVIDKPFVVGDFIIVDEYLGTVQHVGLKTTRLTSLSGEQLVFSNNDLLKSRIRNFKRMNERRVVFTFSVEYNTPLEKLKRIPEIVHEIIEAQERARYDRAHFKEFGEFALVFEVVYHMLVPDFNQYMDVQQAINLELYERLAGEGVQFAYPTQRLYLHNRGGDGQPAAPAVAGSA